MEVSGVQECFQEGSGSYVKYEVSDDFRMGWGF